MSIGWLLGNSYGNNRSSLCRMVSLVSMSKKCCDCGKPISSKYIRCCGCNNLYQYEQKSK